jgi:sec-independent protein translocase protein TatC
MKETPLNLEHAPILTHLIELRRRLLYCLVAFIAIFFVAYQFVDTIYWFLLQPLQDALGDQSQRRMIYTGLHEAFVTYLKLSLFTAAFFTLPLILIQIWKFVVPGLYTQEKRALTPIFVMTPVLFVTGAALLFYVVMPLAWRFFISFETPASDQGLAIQLEARVSEYLDLVVQLIMVFGISFELPVLLVVLVKVGILNIDTLKTHRRHALLGIFFIAAIVTPPDVISQIALAVPIYLLYELSIFILTLTGKAQPITTSNAAVTIHK